MKKRLGDILVARGVVDSLQLQSALAFQRQWGLPLGQVVVDQGFTSAEHVFAALEEQTGLASVNLDEQVLDPRLARLVPLKVAEARKVVPLRLEGVRESTLVVAIAAPASLDTLDLVKTVSGKGRVVPRLATDAAIPPSHLPAVPRGDVRGVEAGDPRSVELPEAEEVMAFMNNCMIEDVVIDNAFFEEDSDPAPTVLHDGLPLLTPLELEPAATVSVEAPPQLVPWAQTERVLVYGWGEAATLGLLRVLEEAGIAAREASAAEVRGATADMVIVSPLPSMEGVGQRVRPGCSWRARRRRWTWCAPRRWGPRASSRRRWIRTCCCARCAGCCGRERSPPWPEASWRTARGQRQRNLGSAGSHSAPSSSASVGEGLGAYHLVALEDAPEQPSVARAGTPRECAWDQRATRGPRRAARTAAACARGLRAMVERAPRTPSPARA